MKQTEITLPELKISYANVAEMCDHVLADNCFFNLIENQCDMWECFDHVSWDTNYEDYANIFIVSEDSVEKLHHLLPKEPENVFLYCEEYDLYFWLCGIHFTDWYKFTADCTFEEFCNEF